MEKQNIKKSPSTKENSKIIIKPAEKEYTDKKKIEKEWRDAVADGHIVSSLEEFIEDKEAGCYDKSS